MAQPVTIESDAFRVDVWPQFGGKVSSIVDKADKFELLYNFPAELPPGPRYDVPYSGSWSAGWDECFPAIAPGPYAGHPYDGINVPDHGELWGLPTTAVPAKGGITVVWHGLRFGYRLTRKLTLDADAIVARYTLVNTAPFDLRFVWSMHALLALTVPVMLDLPRQQCRLSHDAAGAEIGTPFLWPHAPGGVDLSNPHALAPRQAWKTFSFEPASAPARLVYPTRGRVLGLRVEAEVDGDPPAAYWGVWINTGGWGGHRHVSVQPTTGRYDDLARAVRDGSAASVPASGRCDWAVRWSVGPL